MRNFPRRNQKGNTEKVNNEIKEDHLNQNQPEEGINMVNINKV